MHVFMYVMGDLKGLKGLWQRQYGTLFLSRTIFSVFSPCHEKKGQIVANPFTSSPFD